MLLLTPTASDCGAWSWSPGGARRRPRWVGPSFTLSAATGSCVLQPPAVAGPGAAPGAPAAPGPGGQGSNSWMALQLARVACQGPALQWGFVSAACV